MNEVPPPPAGRNPQFAPKKATVPGWVMILLFLGFIVSVGFLVVRIMNNEANKDQVTVKDVEVDPFQELKPEVDKLQIEFRKVSDLRRDETKFAEWKKAHAQLDRDLKKFKDSTIARLKKEGIITIETDGDPDDPWEFMEYSVGFSQYEALMGEVDLMIGDLIRDAPK